MNKELHEAIILKNRLTEKQGTNMDFQMQLNKMRTKLIENEIPLKYVDRFIKLAGEVIPF